MKIIQRTLNEIGHIHGHFIYLSTVILFDISKNSDVIVLDKIYRHTFPSETSGSSNSIQKIFSGSREIQSVSISLQFSKFFGKQSGDISE